MQQEATPEPKRPEYPTEASGEPPTAGSTRRGLLAGVGLAGLAGVVAACGTSDEGATGAPVGSAPAGSAATGGGGGGAVLAKTSEIPVGGGKIFTDQKIVVTQPVQGTFKAFSATCTHRGCTVGEVADGTIDCPCHGSKFAINDASVAGGPAPASLPAKQIVVEGEQIKLV
jgi:nitrite reductase/ring-hydroxylating ferredoxin subunit